MFGVLIESKAGRQRRRGGALMSLLVHGALIAAAIVATTHATVAKATEAPVPDIIYKVKTPPPTPPTPTRADDRVKIYVPDGGLVVIPPIEPLKGIPPITTGPAINDASNLFIVSGSITHDSTLAGRSSSVADPSAIFEENQVEKTAALRSSVRPIYPEVLRAAGVGGRVVVRFIVDTMGLVEHESVVVREASHARFENAVRDVLPRMRFTPALLNGKPVRMLVEMPFEFSIAR